MGGSQSQPYRSYHNKRSAEKDPPLDDVVDGNDNHIRISNKMVERLVDDAAIMGRKKVDDSLPTRELPEDWKENLYIENLEKMDEQHTEKYGLKIEDVRALARRVEARMSRMDSSCDTSSECADQYKKLIDCYNSIPKQDAYQCSHIVDEFSRCIREASIARLQAHTEEPSVKHSDVTFAQVAHQRDHSPPRVSVM